MRSGSPLKMPLFHAPGQLTKLTFRVRAQIELGEQITVSVAGSTGDDVAETLLLVTTPTEYPIWRSPRPLVVPSHAPVRYSLVVHSGDAVVSASPERDVCPVGARFEVELLDDVFATRSAAGSEADIDAAAAPLDASKSGGVPPASGRFEDVLPENSDLVEGCLFITSFTLPVKLTRHSVSGEWSATWDECALHARTEDSCAGDMPLRWVGTVQTHMLKDEVGNPWACEGAAPGALLDDAERAKLVACLTAFDCIPIFLPPKQLDIVYRLMCKEVLWPAMHNTLVLFGPFWKPESGWSPEAIASWWREYEAVSKAFALELASRVTTGDVVWVHDYHLSLLPRDIRTACALHKGLGVDDVGVIYFSHLPFPTWEIFRSLPWRDELLNGIIAGECSFMYRYSLRAYCSQFDSLPLTYLTFSR
jgi:trehalose 6-phosphate synthase/phosphatase